MIGALAARLKDPDEHVRIQAAFNLARLGGGHGALPMLMARVVDHPRRSGDQDSAACVERVFYALSRIATRSDHVEDFLLARFYLNGEPFRNKTFFTLQQTAHASPPWRDLIIAHLRESFEGDDLDRRVAAAFLLDRIGQARETVPTWLDALRRHDDHEVRIRAVIALRNLRPTDPRVLPALREAANDPDPDVRKHAAIGVEVLQPLGMP